MINRVIAGLAALGFTSAAAATCTGTGPHSAAELKYICDSERGWAESVSSGDSSIVKRILADDFIGIAPKGPLYRKAEEVADTRKAPRFFASNHINDVHVRFYGDTAVAQGSETWRKKNGESGRFVWTDTWLKRNGKWQIVAAEDLIAPVN